MNARRRSELIGPPAPISLISFGSRMDRRVRKREKKMKMEGEGGRRKRIDEGKCKIS
jgi:hypothetical protein